MKFSTALTGVLAAAVSVDAAPHLQKRAGTIVVTGVPNNGIQPRLELRQMQQQQPDMFNLYLLGLRHLMQVSQSDYLSWYQIAGIHGRPYIPWDGETSRAGPAGFGGGYCTHVSNIFLTWHRPYLALYEQTLYSHVQYIANTFPANQRARWQSAAKNFRIPYWDWAAPPCSGCLSYPALITTQYVNVNTPTGMQSQLNPLFRYDFQGSPANDFVYDPFASWAVTKRYPTSNDASAVSQNNLILPIFNNNRASLASRLYNLFTTYTSFDVFSNEAFVASRNSATVDSLESVHDAIHSFTGSGGHMTYLDYSAFDPVFFLHHAQIDRLWAMWSNIHPNSYVQPAVSSGTTYTTNVSTTIDANFPMAPFHKNYNRDLFTSNDVASTNTFGYSYPELIGNNVTAAVNRLYGGSTVNRKRDLSALSKRDDGHHYHYITNIVSQKFQMNGSYAVYMFIGQPDDSNPKGWPLADNLAGTHAVFSNLPGKDSIKMSTMDLPVTGTVPLTDALVAKCASGELKDMDPASVTPYLQDNLNWRVSMYDGTVVSPEDVADLSVSIVISDVQPPANDNELPVWGHFEGLPDITSGKKGGHQSKWWQFDSKQSIGDYVQGGMKGNKVKLNY